MPGWKEGDREFLTRAVLEELVGPVEAEKWGWLLLEEWEEEIKV